ncbi:uncharacterized protein TNCV_1695931 [Trichonephila clavipes]|nr:uncharacterized protein TNCV_1695931 [Trichonephila clavipes]
MVILLLQKIIQKRLKARFGREELLVEYYVRELLTLVVKNATKSKLSITQLYDEIESHLRSLDSIGMTSDKYSAMLFPLVESCIPEDILRVWLRNSVSEEKSYSARLTQLLNFLRAEVEGEKRITLAVSCQIPVLDQPIICGSIPSLQKGHWTLELAERGIHITDIDCVNSQIDLLIGSDFAGNIYIGKI